MIVWIMAWLQRWRGAGWFQSSMTGGFPVPDAWQGWAVTAALIAVLTGSAAAPKDFGAPIALVAMALYAPIMYWTFRGD